jgi:hypothetical protein
MRWWVLLIPGLLALSGYLGPWVPHRAAGLVVTGLDLGEYVKFLPEVMADSIKVQREAFYLPLFTASISLALLASRRSAGWFIRTLAAFLCIPAALMMLPPAWSPTAMLAPEYRLQALAIALCCLTLFPGALANRFLPDRLVLALVSPLAVLAGIWPAWGFLLVRPAIQGIYLAPVGLGWGFWLSLLGFLALALVALVQMLSAPATPRRRL